MILEPHIHSIEVGLTPWSGTNNYKAFVINFTSEKIKEERTDLEKAGLDLLQELKDAVIDQYNEEFWEILLFSGKRYHEYNIHFRGNALINSQYSRDIANYFLNEFMRASIAEHRKKYQLITDPKAKIMRPPFMVGDFYPIYTTQVVETNEKGNKVAISWLQNFNTLRTVIDCDNYDKKPIVEFAWAEIINHEVYDLCFKLSNTEGLEIIQEEFINKGLLELSPARVYILIDPKMKEIGDVYTWSMERHFRVVLNPCLMKKEISQFYLSSLTMPQYEKEIK